MKLAALTLLELIIVIAIIALAILLGMWGMLSFKRTVELQQASDEIVATMKETRNFAENNVLPASEVNNTLNRIYAYRINFQNNSLIRNLCYINDPFIGSWNCGTPDEVLKSSIFGDINYDISNGGCRFALFENLTGDIQVDTGGGFADASCHVQIVNKGQSKGIILIIDGVNDTFRLTQDF